MLEIQAHPFPIGEWGAGRGPSLFSLPTSFLLRIATLLNAILTLTWHTKPHEYLSAAPTPPASHGYSGAIYRTWKGLGWFLPLCLCPENTFLFSFSLPFRLSSPPGSLPPTPLSLWLSHHLHSPPLFHVLSDGHRLLP